MNLQERIVRWRGLGAFYEEKQCSALGDTVPTPGTVAIQCAAELEADLRELREALDKLIAAGQEFRQKAVVLNLRTRTVDVDALAAMNEAWDAARCALEARIGAAKCITLNLDFATAGAIGLFEFLRSKGFEAASPAGRAEQVSGSTGADLAGEERDRVKPK